MSDREMLEFAAKAAGWGTGPWVWSERAGGFIYRVNGDRVIWNPIADDGDAMRLILRLRLEPRLIDNSHSNGAEPGRVTLHNFAGIVENIDGDSLAATRRAIVRAAAEIGRSMT